MDEIKPLSLWLTDRTRYTTGLGHCQRDRYLGHHFGPTGYGMVRTSDSLPLATGIYVHRALDPLYRYMQEQDAFPTTEVIRGAISEACAAYLKRIEQRGYAGLLKSERSEYIVTEQQALLTGLVWSAVRTILPWIHQTYKILQVEAESIYILDCTCGLGSANLDASAHADRGCQGIGQMLRQDVVAEKRTDETLAYFENKTTGWVGENWAPQWETRPQLGIGTFGIQEKWGRPISELWIIGLYKGYRKKVEDLDGTWYRQESPLCYGYCRPGNPPLATDDWLPGYEWIDQNGEQKRASRAHKKRGVWELAGSDWPTWVESKIIDPTYTPNEVWAMNLPQSVVEKQVFLVGPMQPQQAQIQALRRQIPAEEQRWREILWQLYEAQGEWSSAEFQSTLDQLVPQSFDCRRYGARHQCQFVDICFHQPGWEDPLSTGKFVPRRPNHQPELEQAISRGLLPEIAEEDEEDEE